MTQAGWHERESEAPPAEDSEVEVVVDEESDYLQSRIGGPKAKPAAKKMPRPPVTPPPGHVIAEQIGRGGGGPESEEREVNSRPITAFSAVMSRLGGANRK